MAPKWQQQWFTPGGPIIVLVVESEWHRGGNNHRDDTVEAVTKLYQAEIGNGKLGILVLSGL